LVLVVQVNPVDRRHLLVDGVNLEVQKVSTLFLVLLQVLVEEAAEHMETKALLFEQVKMAALAAVVAVYLLPRPVQQVAPELRGKDMLVEHQVRLLMVELAVVVELVQLATQVMLAQIQEKVVTVYLHLLTEQPQQEVAVVAEAKFLHQEAYHLEVLAAAAMVDLTLR
jgi:hypothetical protein